MAGLIRRSRIIQLSRYGVKLVRIFLSFFLYSAGSMRLHTTCRGFSNARRDTALVDTISIALHHLTLNLGTVAPGLGSRSAVDQDCQHDQQDHAEDPSGVLIASVIHRRPPWFS